MGDQHGQCPVSQRAAGDIEQLIADSHEIIATRIVTQGTDGPRDPATRDEKAAQVRVIAQHLLNDITGCCGGFVGRLRFQQGEVGIVFPHIGPEAAFVHFLIAEAVVAHKDADLAGIADHFVKGPRGGAADLPVIKPDKADIPAR